MVIFMKGIFVSSPYSSKNIIAVTVMTLSFWTGMAWANSADPDQTAPRGAV